MRESERAEARWSAGGVLGAPPDTLQHIWKKERKIMIFNKNSVFFIFLRYHRPVQRGERRSPLQPSKGRRARTQGHARDAQGHPRVPQVRRGHSQTLRGHIWEILFFMIFLTNLVFFCPKMATFPCKSYENDPKSALFHGSDLKKKVSETFFNRIVLLR